MRIFPLFVARTSTILTTALLVPLSVVFLFTQCMTREDIFGIIEDESIPDIRINYEDTTIPSGVGSIDFGTVQVQTNKAAYFSISNSGGVALHVEIVSLASGDTDQFTLDIAQTSFILTPGSVVDFSILFKPNLVGNLSATIMVQSDDPDTDTYTFEVKGYGSPTPVPDVSVLHDGAVIPFGTIGCDFATILVGESSIAVPFSIENNGTADLEIYGIDVSAGTIFDYVIDDSSLAYTVAPGGSTEFTVVFSPTDAGERTATLSLQSNDADEDPFNFTITGTGEPRVPQIYVRIGPNDIPEGSTGYDFGSITIGNSSAPITITVGNQGTEVLDLPGISSSDPVQFSIDESGRLFSLPPGDVQTTTFDILFQPVDPEGSKVASITILNNDPNHSLYTFQVVGTAAPVPVPDIRILRGLNPISNGGFGFDFGPVEIGQTSPPVTFSIENTGSADLNVTDIISGSSRFTISGTPSLPVDIAPGTNETFEISYSSIEIGQFSTSISISSDDPEENPYTFVVSGEAALPEIQVLRSGTPITNGEVNAYDFGNVLVGDASSPVTFTVENNGDADLSIQGISFVSGDISDFSYDDSSMDPSVPPGGSTTFSVTFIPTVSGGRSATLSIANDDPTDNPYTFTLWGQGEPKIPDIHVLQGSTNMPSGSSSYNYGVVLLGQNSSVQFTVQNTGTENLIVSDISSSSGEFSITNAPSMPFNIAPSSEEYFTARFEPTVAGNRSATISIISNDPDGAENPYTFILQGYGETPLPAIDIRHGLNLIPNTSGIYLFGHVQEGDSKMETFTIENNGTATLIISGILPTSGDTDQFIIDFSIPPISPGSSDTFTISFEPTFPGDKWAIITIVNNDPDDDPYTFRVEGMVGLPPVVDIEVWAGAVYCPDNTTFSGFGNVTVGLSSTPVNFYIWNNGPDDLLIPNIVMTAGDILDFDLDLNSTDLNTSIPPGGNTVFTVTFTPQISGLRWMEMNINYNDPVQTPYHLRLEGYGED